MLVNKVPNKDNELINNQLMIQLLNKYIGGLDFKKTKFIDY